MNIIEARKEGVKAYQTNMNRAPACNGAFTVSACNSETDTAELLGAYLYGWDIANLADGADEGMPSVASLAEIMTG